MDLAIVGGGFGGLAAGVLAARDGLRVALIEAHTRLGGCAGWFDRGSYTFDAGATALMGLGPDEPLGMLARAAGLEFEGAVTPAYRVYLPDRTLDVTAESSAFEIASAAAFPGREGPQQRFWRLQEWVGSTLFAVAARVPRLPVRSASDLAYDLGILGVSGLLAASTWTLTVDQVLGLLGLRGDRPFRSLIAMLLQDTAQAGPDVVPFANAAACLHAYRIGMARPRGGMRALAEGLGQRFAAIGGDLRTGTIVDRVEPAGDGPDAGFVVTTRRREAIRARQVVFNLPIDRAVALIGRPLAGRLARRDRTAKAAWGAFTAYLAFRRAGSAARRSLGATATSWRSAPTCSGAGSGWSATRSSPARGRWRSCSRPPGWSSGSPAGRSPRWPRPCQQPARPRRSTSLPPIGPDP